MNNIPAHLNGKLTGRPIVISESTELRSDTWSAMHRVIKNGRDTGFKSQGRIVSLHIGRTSVSPAV